MLENYFPIMLFVIIGLRLMQQHRHALVEAEQGKAQLELRVREAHGFAHLEEQFDARSNAEPA